MSSTKAFGPVVHIFNLPGEDCADEIGSVTIFQNVRLDANWGAKKKSGICETQQFLEPQ